MGLLKGILFLAVCFFVYFRVCKLFFGLNLKF